jgi:hypothetical protein
MEDQACSLPDTRLVHDAGLQLSFVAPGKRDCATTRHHHNNSSRDGATVFSFKPPTDSLPEPFIGGRRRSTRKKPAQKEDALNLTESSKTPHTGGAAGRGKRKRMDSDGNSNDSNDNTDTPLCTGRKKRYTKTLTSALPKPFPGVYFDKQRGSWVGHPRGQQRKSFSERKFGVEAREMALQWRLGVANTCKS